MTKELESALPKDYYQYTKGGFQDHIWVVHFEDRVIHFWYYSKSLESGDGYVCAGIETHFKQPAEYMNERKPCREDCEFTGGKCWHDGTSLGGSDFYRRMNSEIRNHEHGYILTALRRLYE